MSSKPKAKPKKSTRPGRPLKPSAPLTAKRVSSLRDLAAIIGCSNEALRKARESGEIIVAQDGTIDVEQARAAMLERAMRGNQADESGDSGDDPNTISGLRKKDLRVKIYERQMKVAERRGQLVEKSEVIRAQVERELAFKHVIMALPKRLSPLLVGKGRVEIEAILTQACTDALRHLSSGV